MKDVRFYIEDKLVDINSETEFYFSYTYNDIFDPMKVKNSSSRSLDIIGTSNNNNIFGNIWKLDRDFQTPSTGVTGLNFDPSKRVGYKLFINNDLFDRGYVKLNGISRTVSSINYDITLFGEVGNFLYKLLDKKVVDLPYSNDLRHQINRTLIYAHWNNNANPDYTYIMAENGLPENFNSSKILTKALDENDEFVDKIESYYDSNENISANSALQWRSYHQRPALKIKSVITKILQSSGYNYTLDPTFFNDNNPYWSNSVMTLPLLNTNIENVPVAGELDYIPGYTVDQNNVFNSNTLLFNQLSSNYPGSISGSTLTWPTNKQGSLVIGFGLFVEVYVDSSTSSFRPTADYDCYFTSEPIKFSINNNAQTLLENVYWTGEGEDVDNTKIHFTTSGGGNLNITTMQFKNRYKSVGYNSNSDYLPYDLIDIKTARELMGGTSTIGTKFGFQTQQYIRTVCPTQEYQNTDWLRLTFNVRVIPIETVIDSYGPMPVGFPNNELTMNIIETVASNYQIDKHDIIPKDLTQMDMLVNYTKLFGLIYDYDKITDTINIKTRNTFFNDYKILNWNEKLDKGKKHDITPLSYDSKYYLISYNPTDSLYELIHRSKYDLGYGDKKLNTGYEFNSDEKLLFENTIFDNCVIADKVTSFYKYLDYDFTIRDQKKLPYLCNIADKNYSSINTKYNLLFDNGKILIIDPYSHYYLTDDHPLMFNLEEGVNNPCHIDIERYPGYIWGMDFYRSYDRINTAKTHSWDIGLPLEGYCSDVNASNYNAYSTIYDRFWKNYLEKLYSNKSRILEAYFYLTERDILDFRFSNFVVIDNSLWHVVKIVDYDPCNEGLTLCELIKVESEDDIINSYKNGQIIN